jgi:hypothetical protein
LETCGNYYTATPVGQDRKETSEQINILTCGIRKGITNRSSAHIANIIASQGQRLQRLVLAANHVKNKRKQYKLPQ